MITENNSIILKKNCQAFGPLSIQNVLKDCVEYGHGNNGRNIYIADRTIKFGEDACLTYSSRIHCKLSTFHPV